MALGTFVDLETELRDDTKVKVAGIDADGVMRGKIMSKDKFMSAAQSGFGFCSVIFGWDIHDKVYTRELLISNVQNGYTDIEANIDLASFRRIPWEDNIPFFLVFFADSQTHKPICACPRSVLRDIVTRFKDIGCLAKVGIEYEFYHFNETAQSLADKKGHNLKPLTPGMHGYSLLRPSLNQKYFYELFDLCRQFRVPIEGLHTETGPGVFEVALAFDEAAEIADRAALFKLSTKQLGSLHGIIPSFMAKPHAGLPGTSGHIHISLVNPENGENLFARKEEDTEAEWKDIRNLSDIGRRFLAGVLDGLPDVNLPSFEAADRSQIMPLLAPNINSYKRLVENYWAPVTVSWGLENRVASVRLIAPPTASAKATRLEIRVPGADMHPHYSLAALLALGYRGIVKKLAIKVPPLAASTELDLQGERLPKSLAYATERFMAKSSIAREVFGDEFVDHFGGTRQHEMREYEEAITDWELERYLELA